MCRDKNYVSMMSNLLCFDDELVLSLLINVSYSGDVVTMECVEKLIKKDWINPLDNSKLTPSDIIPLQRVSNTDTV